ncbi:MAG: biopolymer transporter ExbD [Planctomycetota bacterium]
MRRPSPMVQQRSSGTDLDSAMTPMIDVVFLLLVFFVWTASFQIVEQILPSEMSSQMGSEPVELKDPPPELDYENVVVRINWDGQNVVWELNEQPIESLEQLEKRLSTISSIKSDAPVILYPDGVVPLGHVIEVYDVSKLAGFAKVSFAVNSQ